MLTVVTAAIIGHDGKVWTLPRPARHHTLIAHMREHGHPRPVAGEQGFVLSDGRFADRLEAADVALAAKQIPKLNWPPNLYSEDLW